MGTDPLQTVEDRLAENGNAPRRRGDTITARCPAHPDSTPSLDVTRGTHQPLILTCRAGCTTNEVLAALNLTWADVSKPLEKVEHHVVATYPYLNEHNNLLYTVERIEPGYDGRSKSFRQTPASGRRGPGAMTGVRRVPYNLPAVIQAAATNQPIWIVEGEKDANSLIERGEVATTNAGGADSWEPAWGVWFAGAHVNIVVDKDQAGYKRGAFIASVLNGTAATITILEPDSGKDVTDHLNDGKTLDQLVQINRNHCISRSHQLDAQPEAAQPTEQPHRLMQYLVDWDTVWDTPSSASWLIEPFIAAGRAHALFAAAKTGKSLFVLHAVAAACLGEPVFGLPMPQEPIKVLYIDCEMTIDDVLERLTDMGYDHRKIPNLHYLNMPSLKVLDTEEGGQELLHLATYLDVQLVVIDTVSRVVEGEEQSSDTFRHLYRHTIGPLKQAGIATLRLDHAGKEASKGQRGSSAKNDDVDVVYRLDRNDDGYSVTATHRRIPWVQEKTNYTLTEDPWKLSLALEAVPAGTKDVIEMLNAAGVPLDATVRSASSILKSAGMKARTTLISAALKARRRSFSPPVEDDDELV